jgi:hypothetical protein
MVAPREDERQILISLFPEDYFPPLERHPTKRVTADSLLFQSLAAGATDQEKAEQEKKIRAFHAEIDALADAINDKHNSSVSIQVITFNEPFSFQLRFRPQTHSSEDGASTVHRSVLQITCEPSEDGNLRVEVFSHLNNGERNLTPLGGKISLNDLRRYLLSIYDLNEHMPKRVG